jgi:glycosyltransferase involved in cell wall biosynthesis
MKVLFLLNRVQRETIGAVERGETSDDHLYGMLRLRRLGIETDYLEIEQYLPARLCAFLRKYALNVYWVHLPLFFKFRKYDFIYTSTAFGTQLVHTLYPFKKPKWVMLDFSITGLIGNRRTLRQKIFYYIVKRASGIISRSEEEQSKLREMFPEKSKSIYFLRFAVDTDRIKPIPKVPEEDVIFSPGRDPGRDFKTLFEAAKGLGHRVVITTRPWTLKKLLPLPDFVTCKDLSEEEYYRQYAAAKVIVIPLDIGNGINDAMGCSTIVEAAALGKPAIMTATPSARSHMIEGTTAALIPAKDPPALREKLIGLLDSPERRQKMGLAARDFAEKNFSANRSAEMLAGFLKEIYQRT